MGIFFSTSKNSYNEGNNYNYNQQFKQLLNNINKNEQINNNDKQKIKKELQKLKNTYNTHNTYNRQNKIEILTKEKNILVEKVRNTNKYETEFKQIMLNINSSTNLSPKSKKYIKDQLLKIKKFNKNKNKKLNSITSKKNELFKTVIPDKTINVNIYWVRHGFSCANLQKYKGILLKQKNPNLTDLGCYGLLAQQLNLTNTSPNLSTSNNIPSSLPIVQAAGANNDVHELQILKDKLANNQIDLFGASQLIRAIQTQAILFAPFNNGNEIQVLPYISEKGFGKDNEPENQEITKKKFDTSVTYFKSKKYMNQNKMYDLKYDYSKNITKTDLDKFFDETLPNIITNLKVTNLKVTNLNNNEFNLIIVSHQNFIKDIIKKYNLIDKQQQLFDENNTKIPNQSILLQKLKISNNDYKQNNIQQEKLILLSPSNFNVPMPYLVPKLYSSINSLFNRSNIKKIKYPNNQKNWYYNFLNQILEDFSVMGFKSFKNKFGQNKIKPILTSIIKNNKNLLNKMYTSNINSSIDFMNYLKKDVGNNLDDIIKNKYNLIMIIINELNKPESNIKLSDFDIKFLIFENNPNVIDFKKQINDIIKLSEGSRDLFDVLFESCDNLPSIFNRSRNKNKFKKQIL
jgi:broad specificity phosphatase PhoE